ncbi:MAG: hypothetical protein DRO07_02020 [Candidatus Iainarchaeum archaeon]|uniref:HTH arsR-type domain-containing protein n=1 Tax=Candidatus Iainarchaeum sp. TaxID=3101447 RepID=A0A497JFF4_9ARCH|nr:MAG: hypothetical protein DRO07_02020 [Candidatus Diapherotrites archaeon]
MRALSCPLFFDIFASKSRMAIIRAIWNKPRSVQEICEQTGLEQSNVSHQLKLLKRCHIVKVKHIGRNKIYGLENSIRPIIKAAENHLKKHCRRRCKEWFKKSKK